MASHYATLIASILDTQHLNDGPSGPIFTPRHVEAFMRLDHPTLDGLTRDQFVDEVVVSCECILVGGTAYAELIAQSFGL